MLPFILPADMPVTTVVETRPAPSSQDAIMLLVNSAPLPDNAPENIYAQVFGPSDKLVATIYKKGIVATSNDIAAKMAPQFEKLDSPKDRAEAIAKEVGGTVVYKE
jgi:hypothetical protein